MKEPNTFKSWCAERGYTAARISADTGISKRTVWSYMQGERSPSRKTRRLLEDTYGMNTRDVFGI